MGDPRETMERVACDVICCNPWLIAEIARRLEQRISFDEEALQSVVASAFADEEYLWAIGLCAGALSDHQNGYEVENLRLNGGGSIPIPGYGPSYDCECPLSDQHREIIEKRWRTFRSKKFRERHPTIVSGVHTVISDIARSTSEDERIVATMFVAQRAIDEYVGPIPKRLTESGLANARISLENEFATCIAQVLLRGSEARNAVLRAHAISGVATYTQSVEETVGELDEMRKRASLFVTMNADTIQYLARWLVDTKYLSGAGFRRLVDSMEPALEGTLDA